jgi:2-polyprenyl-3-methyl-5-hydroxy-6-metoxy-1,4-benzoquinol methylase
MSQYKDKLQIKSLIKQAHLINEVLDKHSFETILDIGTGPGIIKRVLTKQGKLCHTVEQKLQWQEFAQFNPQIDFRMGYYKDRQWELPAPRMKYDCVVLARFFDLFHTEDDFESVTTTLTTLYSDNILILHNPKAWRLNTYVQKKAIKYNTTLWPIYLLSK